MRKTIQRLLGVVLGLGFIALQAGSLVSANLTSSEQTLIDGFIERRADSYSQNEASSKAISIQERIAYTLQVITPNDFTLDILQYIDVVLNQYILTTPILIITPSTPVVTVPSIPVPLAQDSSLLTLIENFDESREVVVLAGEQQQVVAEFELNARLEPFVLEDITIGSSVSDIQNTIAQLHLYDENGSKLGSDRADSSGNFDFKNLGYTLEQGTTKVYAVIDTMIVGYNGNGQNDLVALTLQVTDGEARGEFSSTKYSINQSNTSKTITIQSVLIKSVDFISEAEGVRVDTQLTNGNNTLAILEIQTADSSNQEVDSSRDLDVLLDTLQIQISDNTVGDSATNSLVLERLDTNGKRIVGTVVGDQVIFTFDDDDTAGLIQNGESAYYRIVAENVQLSPSQGESVSIEISNAREAVIYHSSDPSSSLFGKNGNKNFFIQNSSLSD